MKVLLFANGPCNSPLFSDFFSTSTMNWQSSLSAWVKHISYNSWVDSSELVLVTWVLPHHTASHISLTFPSPSLAILTLAWEAPAWTTGFSELSCHYREKERLKVGCLDYRDKFSPAGAKLHAISPSKTVKSPKHLYCSFPTTSKRGVGVLPSIGCY